MKNCHPTGWQFFNLIAAAVNQLCVWILQSSTNSQKAWSYGWSHLRIEALKNRDASGSFAGQHVFLRADRPVNLLRTPDTNARAQAVAAAVFKFVRDKSGTVRKFSSRLPAMNRLYHGRPDLSFSKFMESCPRQIAGRNFFTSISAKGSNDSMQNSPW